METVKYLWQCLYKNQAVIDGRKRKDWWTAIIIFILSLVLIMIPLLTSGYKTAGASALAASNEKGINVALDSLVSDDEYSDFQNLYFEKDSNGEVVLNTTETFRSKTSIDIGLASELNEYNFKHSITEYVSNTNSDGSTSYVQTQSEEFVYFSVYYTQYDILTSEGQTAVVNSLSKINSTDNTLGTAYHSYILFAQKSFMLAIYPNSPVNLSSIKEGKTSAPTYSSISGLYSGLDVLLNDGKYQLKFTPLDNSIDSTASKHLWVDILNQGYRPIRDANTWQTVGITVGIAAGLVLIGGLIIWLFTLGKRNKLHKDCNIWQAIQMSMMMNFTVALIGMIVMFFNSIYGVTALMMCYVLRLSYLIMRTGGRLDANQGEDKPLYQARS